MTGLPALTAINSYVLLQTVAHFNQAVTALVDRVEQEGARGVVGYRFYVNPTEKTVRAVVDYLTPGSWIAHHELAMGWPEMKRLHDVARLEQITFLGDVPMVISNWLAASPLTAEVRSGYGLAAGFRRCP